MRHGQHEGERDVPEEAGEVLADVGESEESDGRHQVNLNSLQLENTNRWQISSCESNSKIAGHHLEVISESHRHLIIIV